MGISMGLKLGQRAARVNYVLNGSFTSDLSLWTPAAGWTWEAGKARITAPGVVARTLTQVINLPALRQYRLTYTLSDLVGISGNDFLVGAIGDAVEINRTAAGTYETTFTANTLTPTLSFRCSGTASLNDTLLLDDVSIVTA